MRRLAWSGALLGAAVAAGLAPVDAQARIGFDGIGGVEIGMTEAAVTHAVGPEGSRTDGGGDGTTLLDYPRRRLDVLLRAGRVIRVRTTSRAERTSAGVGPGTSLGVLRRKLRGERCATARGARVCWVDRGDRVMAFSIRRGRVTFAEVARGSL